MPKISKNIITNFGFQEKDVRPVLVDFQNGKIQIETDNKIESAIFRDEKEGKLHVGISTGKMIYSGIVDNDSDLYNNFIVVPEEKSNRVKLIQVDHAVVSPLLEKKNLNQVTCVVAEKSVAQLNKQFGSKKTKRQTEQRERLKMNIDTVKDQLEKTVTDISINETDLSLTQSSENESLYRPSINREASTKEQVYSLHDLVPEAVLHSLSEKSVKIINNEEDMDSLGFYPCILKNLKNIQTSELSDGRKIEKFNIFLYINNLIKFSVTPMKNFTKRFVICDYSTLADHHIKDNFAVHARGGLQRPLSMKDKAVCYILVLLLIACDYEAEIEELSKDLKIGLKKLQECCRVLSLSQSAKGKNIFTLKLPLPAPVIPSSKRKRK